MTTSTGPYGTPAPGPHHAPMSGPSGPAVPGPVPTAPHPTSLLTRKGRMLWRLPTVPVDYQHVLRGRGYRWWKGLLGLLFVVVAFLALQLGLGVLLAVFLLLTGDDAAIDSLMSIDLGDPLVLTVMLGGLALLIPLSFLGVRLIFGVRAGYLSSVEGRFRWGWAAKVLVVLLPLWVLYMAAGVGLEALLTEGPAPALSPPENWPVLLVLVLLLAPLQSAGEEYAFRGFLLQSMGSWFRSRWLALVVPGVFSVILFSLAHGSFDPFILVNLALFAAAAVHLTWRTGGLEAAVVLHAVNNVVVFLYALGAGEINDPLIDEQAQGSALQVPLQLVLFGAAVLLVTWLARRSDVQRQFQPVEIPESERLAPPAPVMPPIPGPYPQAPSPYGQAHYGEQSYGQQPYGQASGFPPAPHPASGQQNGAGPYPDRPREPAGEQRPQAD